MIALALLSIVVALMGWTSMAIVLKIPALRRTMWPVWLIQLLSFGLAATALLTPGNPIISLGGAAAVLSLSSFALFLLAFALTLYIPSATGRPEIGKPFPDFLVTAEDGKQVPPRKLLGSGPSMVVFFRGFWCMSCTDELMGLHRVRDALHKRGGDILAVSADKLPVLLSGKQRLHDFPCKLACDPGGEALGKLNLLQLNMLKLGKRVAVPSTILIDENGIVRWVHYAGIVMDRPDPRLVLQLVENLK